jgi:hypothetical protein
MSIYVPCTVPRAFSYESSGALFVYVHVRSLTPISLHVVLYELLLHTKTDARKMPKIAPPLSDIQVRNAKGGIKPKGTGDRLKDEATTMWYTMADGSGLFLRVETSGAKLWRMQYRFGGKPGTLSFGKYPTLG